MLEARDISIVYGEREAVRNVSLRIAPKGLTCILGANGAGKSSLLRALNGSLAPLRGGVYLDGKLLRSLARRVIARRIAFIAQEAEVRFPISVLEFVLGGRFAWGVAGAWGWETRQDVEAAHEALRETDLTKYAWRRVDELSGGERQRVVLARALATQADILLLDEPTANLDLAHQAATLNLVRARCDKQSAAAIVITHELNLAAEFADNVLLMKNGEALAMGAPFDVLTPQLLREAFGVRVLVDAHPLTNAPRITPVYEKFG